MVTFEASDGPALVIATANDTGCPATIGFGDDGLGDREVGRLHHLQAGGGLTALGPRVRRRRLQPSSIGQRSGRERRVDGQRDDAGRSSRPGASAPTSHLTSVCAGPIGLRRSTDTKVAPAGTASTSVTASATDGPWFVAVSRN